MASNYISLGSEPLYPSFRHPSGQHVPMGIADALVCNYWILLIATISLLVVLKPPKTT